MSVNDEALGDEKAVIARDALRAGGVVKLSLGRKRRVLLRAVSDAAVASVFGKIAKDEDRG